MFDNLDDRSIQIKDIASTRIPHGSAMDVSLNDFIATVQTIARLPDDEGGDRRERLEAHVNMLLELRDKFGAETRRDVVEMFRNKRFDAETVEGWIKSGAIIDMGLVTTILYNYEEQAELFANHPTLDL
jgi:ABC-type Fe3+-citrate transport system substrate-binding protein